MKSILNQYDTKSVNTSDLTPHAVNRDKNIKLLKELDARNKSRISKQKYNFKDMLSQLKSRPTVQSLVNPAAYAVKLDGNSNPENQKMELIRMAKATFAMARRKNPFIISDYDDVKNKFMSDYSKKIHQFRMIPTIEGIYEQFKDGSYKEKGYDSTYLGQGTSDNYLRSLQSARESDELKKALESLQANQSTDSGKIQMLLEDLSLIQLNN